MAARKAAAEKLITDAKQAIKAGSWFDAHANAFQALRKAHAARQHDNMAHAALLLADASEQIQRAAREADTVYVVEHQTPNASDVVPGLYLVQPPRVGVDGRSIREAAMSAKVPVTVVVREPTTDTGLWPIVAINAVTVRVKVRPPKKKATKKQQPTPPAAWCIDDDQKEEGPAVMTETIVPEPDWFIDAIDELACEAMDEIDPETDVFVRVESLIERVVTIPEHPGLARELAKVCTEAHTTPKTSKKTTTTSALDEEEE